MSCTFLLQVQGDLSRVSEAVLHLKRRESDLFTFLVLLLTRWDLCFTRLYHSTLFLYSEASAMETFPECKCSEIPLIAQHSGLGL